MTEKLLHKTLKYYLSFSLLVMLLAAPLFYFVTQFLYLEEADEGLVLLKKEFIENSIPKLKENDIEVWNKLNRNVKINKVQENLKEDTFFYKKYYDTLDVENEPYRVLVSPVTINGKDYTFFARTNLVEKKDLIVSIIILFVVIIAILLIGLFIITKRVSLTLWKPFYETLEQIERFEIDKNLDSKLTTNNIEEFNRLNLAIKKNTLIYKSQEEFIENAAHELQTPIAIFKGKLETLLQRSDVTEEQFEILDKLNDTATRLNRLNKNLLLLSKIESKQYNILEDVILDVVITNQLDFFKEQAFAKNISIATNLESGTLIRTNPFLSEILISNLFLNTINHNIINGIINVVLDKNSLIFSNTGIPKSLEINKLFERFSKVNPSSKGNGLGLSIIKKIADNNQWNVIYNFKDNLHIFEIRF
ncbi:HAMP domain-containing histidine kinase [Flavobacterium sp. ZT3R18]|uniref:sensor histidine kinase n=1 Tax=Flavobacterium sp. ZT3R18 TaxID=2594429 RepID=UPI00117B9E34|nr:HAMP domain-containing sensor histidine kinase [Flavobacterium sp. ZT3R18]TRX31653.1 HAMP domain-containing histidine kinase [Flavobacterium sp. ZT3R18]